MAQWRRPAEQTRYVAPPPPPPMSFGPRPYNDPPHVTTYEGLEHISEQVEGLRSEVAELRSELMALKALVQEFVQRA